MTLLELIEGRLECYGNRGGIADTARAFLGKISCFGLDLKGHVCRVALIAERVAVEEGKDPKAAFYGGLLHDFGKVLLPEQLFDGHDIDRLEYERVKSHAERGFQLLADHHLFSALVAGLHHAVSGEAAYGITSEDLPESITEELLQKAVEMARLISLADFADASLHRRTKLKDGTRVSPTLENLPSVLAERFGPRAPVDAVMAAALALKDEYIPDEGCDGEQAGSGPVA